MIDTDKYEGHTEGEWVTNNFDGGFNIISDKWGVDIHTSNTYDEKPLKDEDIQLMADAPLLLAEVKRLHSQYEELKEALIGDVPDFSHDKLMKLIEKYDTPQSRLAEVKRLQKELRKQTNIVGMISDLVYDGGSHNLTWDELNEILGDVVKE